MKKLTLLAIAAAAMALLVVPAMASAAGWDIDPENGKFPLNFTSSGGPAKLTTSLGSVSCTGNTGNGSYENATTGTLTQTFNGCTDVFGGECKSGTTAGQIVTFTLPFHNIMIENTGSPSPYANGTMGVLITPSVTTGDYATFTCKNLGLVTVTGNGLIGDVSSPECGTGFSNTATLKFEVVSSKQKWMTEETGATNKTEYDLKADLLGSTVTAGQEAEGKVIYTGNAKPTCP